MRRCIPALVLIALSAAVPIWESPRSPRSLTPTHESTRLPGPTTQDVRYIVVLNTPSGPTVTTSVVSSLGVTPDFVYEHAITGFVATLTPAQVQALQSDPQVAWVEEDQPVQHRHDPNPDTVLGARPYRSDESAPRQQLHIQREPARA